MILLVRTLALNCGTEFRLSIEYIPNSPRHAFAVPTIFDDSLLRRCLTLTVLSPAGHLEAQRCISLSDREKNFRLSGQGTDAKVLTGCLGALNMPGPNLRHHFHPAINLRLTTQQTLLFHFYRQNCNFHLASGFTLVCQSAGSVGELLVSREVCSSLQEPV